MSITKELILLQTPQEQTAFINFLTKRNKRHDTRNIQLYKDFIKGKEKRLLADIKPNAYNALKKRLTDLLIDFSARQALSSELSEENRIIKYVVISRKLINQGAILHGMSLLKKAEIMALKLDHHSLLNEIYHTTIEHAHKQPQLNLDELFVKLKKNNEQFIAQEKLSVLYARMHGEFIGGDFHKVPKTLEHSLNDGLKEFDIQPELILNFKSLNQLCTLADLYAAQTKNYDQLDLFFEKHIGTLKGTEKDTEKMLPYHVELLYGLANIHFRKKNFSRSQNYLEAMRNELQRYSKKLETVWLAKYTNLLALNLNFSGNYADAISMLTDFLNTQKASDSEKALLRLTLSMFHFQQGHLNEVKNQLLSLDKTDHWYLRNLGNEWLFNYKAIEILLHFDLGNDLLAESRISAFKRKYGNHIKTDRNNPIWPFLMLIKSILFDLDKVTTNNFKLEVEKAIPWKGKGEDFFNMCFYSWLKAKMINRPVYDTTLDLIK